MLGQREEEMKKSDLRDEIIDVVSEVETEISMRIKFFRDELNEKIEDMSVGIKNADLSFKEHRLYFNSIAELLTTILDKTGKNAEAAIAQARTIEALSKELGALKTSPLRGMAKTKKKATTVSVKHQ